MSVVRFYVNFDADGKITGVTYNDALISIEEWNKLFTDKSAEGNVGSEFY